METVTALADLYMLTSYSVKNNSSVYLTDV